MKKDPVQRLKRITFVFYNFISVKSNLLYQDISKIISAWMIIFGQWMNRYANLEITGDSFYH